MFHHVFTFQYDKKKHASTILWSASLRPTLEDARSWSTSFEKVMKSAAGRSCFRQFLRTEFSEENMMFWLACEELKKETNKTVVEEKVRQTYEDFISILSPKEVSHLGCNVKVNCKMLLLSHGGQWFWAPTQSIFHDKVMDVMVIKHPCNDIHAKHYIYIVKNDCTFNAGTINH